MSALKKKLEEYGLFPRTKKEIRIANMSEEEKKREGKFFLNNEEIKELINYLQISYIP